MSQVFTREEVASHNTDEDCYIIIHNKVYDVTKFARFHPGGRSAIVRYAGMDCTEDFVMLHPDNVLQKYARFCVGTIRGVVAPEDKEAKWRQAMKGDQYFGDMIPYGDPNFAQGWVSKYYTKSHFQYRAAVRAFVEKELLPNIDRWEKKKELPKEIFLKAGAAGILGGVAGAPWQTKYVGNNLPGGINADDYDAFHELILYDELTRCAAAGVLAGLTAGLMIGLPPILLFGSDELKMKCAKPCLTGEKTICLAITEPFAGSDVAGLRATARKTPDGQHYIVNGEKKWITNGTFADFFTVAVRTGGKGMGGISLLLLERGMPGLKTVKMSCGGGWSSGTSYITFDNVKVPCSNLIGKENQGFKLIMYNFNHGM
jgi:alkylation response protein AidB-like acyl-CoA dehydrogenase/predicted heme/steroid binding protein